MKAQGLPATKLISQITVDGLRADTINRDRDQFVEGGFNHFFDPSSLENRDVHRLDIAPRIATYIGITPPPASCGSSLSEVTK